MEKIDPKVLFRSLSSSFRSVATGNMNPDLSWRILVVICVIAAIVIGIFALLSYRWAGTLEDPAFTPRSDRDAVSAQEIHEVINYYAAKQKRYQDLEKKAPSVPGIGKEIGASLKASDALRSDVLDVGTDALPPELEPN